MNLAVLDDEHARRLATEIVGRPEYAHWQPYRLRSRLIDQLIEWLRGIAGWFDALRFESPGLYWTMMILLLFVAALLLAHVVWSIRVAMTAARREPERGETPSGNPFTAEAAILAGDGHFLEAAHRLQLATIDLLLRRQLVDLSRFEPNRILRRRLREAPLPVAERDDLLSLIDRLEKRWFRDRSEDRELYERWHALYARLQGLPA